MSEKNTLLAIQEVQQCLLNLSPDESTEDIHIACKKLFAFSWLLDAFRFYRRLDFFADTAHLTDSQVTERFVATLKKNAQGFCIPSDAKPQPKWFDAENFTHELADLNLLTTDTKRVWFHDLEADVCEENQSYTHLLQQLSQISRGLFLPKEIEENWDPFTASKKRIVVTFLAQGKRWKFEPDYCDDWLDLNAPLTVLNELLLLTGYSFVSLETTDQRACLVVLNENEKNEIFTKRHILTAEHLMEEFEEWNALQERE